MAVVLRSARKAPKRHVCTSAGSWCARQTVVVASDSPAAMLHSGPDREWAG